MGLLREVSPLVEPLSLDEAFVDLAAADLPGPRVPTRHRVRRASCGSGSHEVTGGLTASVGIGTSKFIAKVASDLDKPDGLVVVPPGHRAGPAAADARHGDPRRRAGHRRAAAAGRRPHRRRPGAVSEDELVRLLGKARGTGLYAPRPRRGRPAGGAPSGRPSRSASRAPTTPTSTDRRLMEGLLDPAGRQRRRAAAQARPVGPHGHDQGAAARLHHPQPLDDAALAHRQRRARSAGWPAALLAELDTSGGVRLLGVGVSGLADWIQEDLFGDDDAEAEDERRRGDRGAAASRARRDLGARHGRRARRAWAAAGCGARAAGVVTVRFETAETAAGPGAHATRVDDPALSALASPRRARGHAE